MLRHQALNAKWSPHHRALNNDYHLTHLNETKWHLAVCSSNQAMCLNYALAWNLGRQKC